MTGGTGPDKRQVGPDGVVTVGTSAHTVTFTALNAAPAVLTVLNNPLNSSVKVAGGTTVPNVGQIRVVVNLV